MDTNKFHLTEEEVIAHHKLLDQHQQRLDVIEAEKRVPSTTMKEMQMLKVRLDRIELLVGLKREPVLQQVPDSARIS